MVHTKRWSIRGGKKVAQRGHWWSQTGTAVSDGHPVKCSSVCCGNAPDFAQVLFEFTGNGVDVLGDSVANVDDVFQGGPHGQLVHIHARSATSHSTHHFFKRPEFEVDFVPSDFVCFI